MSLCSALTILVLIGLCQGINWNVFDDFSWDNLKNHANNAYNEISDQAIDISDDIRDYFERNRKRSPIQWSLFQQDYNRILETTTVRTSGLVNNEATVEVSSYFQLDILWSITIDGIVTQSMGSVRQEENIFISSYTLRIHQILSTSSITCHIPLTNHFINLEFTGNGLSKASTQHFGQLGITYRGPFSSTLQRDGAFEFDVEFSSPENTTGLNVQYAYFNIHQSYEKGVKFEDVRYENDVVDHGKTHFTANVGNHKIGEFLMLIHGCEIANSFTIFAAHRIDIPRDGEVQNYDKVFFDISFRETFEFQQNIRYGALHCYAVGQPMPVIDIFKDGVRVPSVSLPQLRAATLEFVSFNGRTIDEVEGTYICRATSGDETVFQRIIVKEKVK